MTTQPTTTNALDAKTLLLAIDFGRFGNTRTLRDDQYTVDAKKDYTAAAKKRLQSDALEAVRNHDNCTRRWIESKTLPSLLKPGIYRVPMDRLGTVINFLETRRTERAVLVEKFRAAYDAAVALARADLGPLFDAEDYPDVDTAIAEFSMSWRFLSSGVPESLAAANPSAYAEELVKYHEHITHTQQAYTSLMRVAMADLVEHLVTMLQPAPDGRKKRIFAAGFENLGEFLKDFPSRNVADDKELAALAAKAEGLLNGVVDVEAIRDDENMRKNVLDRFSEIKGTLDTLVTIEDRKIGKRKIKLTEAA